MKKTLSENTNSVWRIVKKTLSSKYFFGPKLLSWYHRYLHASVQRLCIAQCVYNVFSKNKMSASKAMVQVEFPVYAI